MLLTADFETTTNEDDCRVWAWGVCDIENPEYFECGNDIDSFFSYLMASKNSTFYFHNLKFDGEFIMVWLFENGFTHVKNRKDEATKTFTTLISDMGQFYSIKIIFEKKGRKTRYVQIYDSLKILPFSVAEIAKGFNLPIQKLELDYKKERPKGHTLTEEEKKYLRNDVEIVARALKVLFDQGLTKMTQGSNALHDYKETIGLKNFDRWFPTPDYDYDVRQAYKGGFTYLNPKYKEVDIGTGLVFDVNSLYPWVLRDCPLPYDDPIFFRGKYEPDEVYNLYVQMFTCSFELKKDHIPTIQLKENLSFIPTEYLSTSKVYDLDGELLDDEVTMCLTSVDLELFMEHYDVDIRAWHSGWKFKSTTGLFSPYIDKWMKVKIESTINGNKSMRTLAKLMLNALYGKFSTSPKVTSKYPVYEEGVIKYKLPRDDDGRIIWDSRKGGYIPVGAFVTAWARHKTITSAQKVYPYFVYADTDSLHLNLELPDEIVNLSNKELEKLTTADLQKYGIPLPDDFIIDPVALGAWKLESKFQRARFIRQKSYIEDWNHQETWDKAMFSSSATEKLCEVHGWDYKEEVKLFEGLYDKDLLNITCAGMPKGCYKYVNWHNFHEGAKFAGKLMPKHVKGGIVLVDIEFTIQKG